MIGILSQFLNFPFVRLGTFIAYIPAFINRTGINIGIGIVNLITIGIKITVKNPSHPDVSDPEIANAFEASENEQTRALSSGRLSLKGVNSLYNYSSEAAKNPNVNPDVKKSGVFRYKLFAYLLREVPDEGNALVGKETELYTVYDRLVSEYEFRIGISLPLTALVITLATLWSPLWLLAAFPLLVLLATGSQQRMAAGDLLADAVRLRRIEIALPTELVLTETSRPSTPDL